ncbi:MAG: hypothetical protein SF187_14445 [Deltaproteobacteria bacterium]|nr:hypothetical protein [Deltaproteobacteria bacterium]
MDDRCPKCNHKKASPAAQACPRCGLVFALWKPEEAPQVVALDEAAEALWAKAVADWNNTDAHDAFLKHCSVLGMLSAAGRRYRERLDERPTDEVAQQMQKRVLAMATALLGAPPQKPPAPFTRSGGFWMVLLCALFVGIIAALTFRRH